ncbi:arylalkylamine N-acetyltransferase-like 2 [Zeugodacus cucurbitae]|nr:arylalkylamine N-acetyltransferase-like 2 [Zeugodacus cucurbitae]
MVRWKYLFIATRFASTTVKDIRQKTSLNMAGDQIQENISVSIDKSSLSKSDCIQIQVIQLCDRDKVLDFLRSHYYQEEPLTIGSEPKEQDPEDEKFNMSQITHGTCLMALSGEYIVGVLISGPKSSNEAEHLFEDAARFGPTKWGAALTILACAERDSNVYKRYNIAKALHIHILAVDAKLRGRAIGSRLIGEVKNLGRQLSYPLLTLDCTSYYSARLCERLNMDCVNVIKYEDYLDEEGKPIFKPPPPHEFLKTFATIL